MSTATRRLKWHPSPPPPSPRILNLPRRHRRRPPKPPAADSLLRRSSRRAKLETLFHQERAFSKTVPIVVFDSGCERRERVEEGEEEEEVVAVAEAEEERWRVEAEILRAECNFLRMEREVAVKKLEKSRVHMESALRSAVQTIISGKKKICEGKSVSTVLEEEIEDLAEKLEELQRSSDAKDLEVKKCSNFDKQTSLLQRRLEKLGGISEKCVKEIQEIAEASLSINTSCSVGKSSVSNRRCNKFMDVEILRRKMEGLSRGVLLERMKEEYGSMLSTANSSIASSASTSRRIEAPDFSSSPVPKPHQETLSHEKHGCSGRCKVIVRRIMEQVRTETEQWSQMQEMLEQVREEMEELNASRDFWEDRALDSDCLIQYLHSAVEEWKQKALSSNDKANELQAQVFILSEEINNLRKEQSKEATRATAQNEMEKRLLVCHMKENHQANSNSTKQEVLSEGRRKTYTPSAALLPPRRSPFREIGNLAPMLRQNSKAIFPLHCPEPSKTK
ncbi:hypothetical protein PVL29_007235 [Vitis rotundifolia]|uniref:Uncharacterized protein n=1 Tax=Vitis rotundifolia TaxID=103349 RepID=A0AA38ZZE4_VITRO|nr:hypothetical protein PVL29_007235 [Vitis rotundifolia]